MRVKPAGSGHRNTRPSASLVAHTMQAIADDGAVNAAAEAAIARVLRGEREARQSVDAARLAVEHIAEDARGAARALAERTERRIRRIGAAFERAASSRVAELDALGAQLDPGQSLNLDQTAAVRRAVQQLARELIGAPP